MGNFASENFSFLTLKKMFTYLHTCLLWQRHVSATVCICGSGDRKSVRVDPLLPPCVSRGVGGGTQVFRLGGMCLCWPPSHLVHPGLVLLRQGLT